MLVPRMEDLPCAPDATALLTELILTPFLWLTVQSSDLNVSCETVACNCFFDRVLGPICGTVCLVSCTIAQSIWSMFLPLWWK